MARGRLVDTNYETPPSLVSLNRVIEPNRKRAVFIF